VHHSPQLPKGRLPVFPATPSPDKGLFPICLTIFPDRLFVPSLVYCSILYFLFGVKLTRFGSQGFNQPSAQAPFLPCSTKWSLELSRATPISCRQAANPVKNPRPFFKSIPAICLQGNFGSNPF
jgi:hypothetical protein